uniref:Uncharacterized protein n=1 Tax=Anopheles albimanus TaxID=7167 RepID=A0A182FZA3_ANOAL
MGRVWVILTRRWWCGDCEDGE